MSSSQKHILISLSGRTPQILTETLYVLRIEKRIPISEIWVFTTKEGQQAIRKHLLKPEHGKFYTFCEDWNIPSQEIEFDDRHIIVAPDFYDDHSTAGGHEDNNNLLVNKIMNKLEELTNDPDNVLYCSIAGGRKTMSAYFGFALQFFGRPQDKLFHILVQPDELQNNEAFYYIPPHPQIIPATNGANISTHDAAIELVEIPYVHLRNKIHFLFGELPETGQQSLNYNNLTELTQQNIDNMPDLHVLNIYKAKRCLEIGGKHIDLTPIEMTTYVYYAERSKKRPDDIPVRDYEKYFEYPDGAFFPGDGLKLFLQIYRSFANHGFVERFESKLENGNLKFDCICQYKSRINKKITNVLKDEDLASYYIISGILTYRKCYGIKLDKSKILIHD